MSDQDERLGTSEDAPQAARRGRSPRNAQMGATRAALSPDELSDERMDAATDMNDGFEGDDQEEQSDDDLLDIFLDSLNQTVLPALPEIPGYHLCWLTTSNPRDSLQWRQRVGYSLLKYSDFPGMSEIGGLTGTGNPTGLIQVNEMIAAKIPLRLYNRLMAAVHHRLPLVEEQKLQANVEQMADAAERHGARIIEGDGTRQIVQRAKPMPEFRA